jgi:hypothetical protein
MIVIGQSRLDTSVAWVHDIRIFMNKPFVLQSLQDACDELGKLIEEVKADDDGFGALYAGMPLLYRYLNLAWNSTQIPEEELFRNLEQEGMPKALWGFPDSLDLLIDD